MADLIEGNVRISIPDSVAWRKFDDVSHGLSHCMKAVDFIVELADRIFFIEIKNPPQTQIAKSNVEIFVKDFHRGREDEDLIYKYRDTFLYEWASDNLKKKPVFYLVLIASDGFSESELSTRTEALERKLPLKVPDIWKRNIADGCMVFNIQTWNRYFHQYPASRL